MDVNRKYYKEPHLAQSVQDKKKISDQRINPELATGDQTSQKSGLIGPRRFERAWSDGPDAGGGHAGTLVH